MAQQVINVGTSASDGTGDPLRDAFTKVNNNFTELYATVENEGLTYGNVASNVSGITFNVTRYTETYSASPVLRGANQVVGNVFLIQGNVLGGTTPLNDLLLTVTTLANATVGNIATVSAVGVPVSPVLRVNGLTGNVTLTVNNIEGAASKAYVNSSIASNIANVTGSVTDSLRANITAANIIISNHSARITTLESNSAAQASQINNLVSVKANVSYVDISIENALSGNAILANVALINANVAAANAAILLRANLSGANFTGNISANSISSSNLIRTDTYFVGGTVANQSLGQSFGNPAALFFANTFGLINRYYQINLQNLDPTASGDICITADDGTDASNFVSMGVNGSLYNDPYYPSGRPHDGFVYVTGGNLALQSNTANIDFYTGNVVNPQISLGTDNVFYLFGNTSIRFSDGTYQTTAFGGNANLSSINANITAANIAISALQANSAAQALELDNLVTNAATQGSAINTLTANAASQATSLNSLNANVGAYQTFANANAATQTTLINSINANIQAANAIISSLQSNATSQALEIDNLTSNSASQGAAINSINANIIAANLNIATLLSNAVTQALEIDNLSNNFNSQESNLTVLTSNVNLLWANMSAANSNISTLSSNAATQGTQINSLNANVTAANLRIQTIQANLGAFQTWANLEFLDTSANLGAYQIYSNSVMSAIGPIQANLGAYQIFANANATVQALQVDNLVVNKANLSGAIFTGNIEVPYLIATSNIKTAGQLEVGLPTSENLSNSLSSFVGNINQSLNLYLQNKNSGDRAASQVKVIANDGNADSNYTAIGITSSSFGGNFTVPAGDTGIPSYPYDGFVVTIGGNSSIVTDNNVFMVANTSVVGLQKDGDFFLFCNLRFRDGTIQKTAISDVPGLYSNLANLDANITTVSTNLSLLEANVGAFENYIDANVGIITNDILDIYGNLANLSSNIFTLTTDINLLEANVGAFETYIDSNVGIISNDILDINSNLANLSSNIFTITTDINLLEANVGAFENYIDSNVGVIKLSLDSLDANSGAYQITTNNKINAINANVTAANLSILTKANLTGDIFSGNVQANYLIANANVKIGSTLEVGLPANLNLPALTNHFVGNANTFYRLNLQNLSSESKAASELRVSADNATSNSYYAGFGITSSTFTGNFVVPSGDTGIPSYPYDGYFVTIGGNSSVVTDGNVFLVANTSVVALQKDGDLLLLDDVKLRFSNGTFFANANIGAQTYTPNNASNYNATITNIQQALDELAARLRALGG